MINYCRVFIFYSAETDDDELFIAQLHDNEIFFIIQLYSSDVPVTEMYSDPVETVGRSLSYAVKCVIFMTGCC